ncbi:MAG: O-antigen ligase family protein [Mycetocola sp.]
MSSFRVLPPSALSTERLWATGVGTLALFIAFAGDGIRNLLTIWGFAAISILVALVCLVLMIRLRPAVDRTRLPLALIGFLALAVLSLIWSVYPSATLLTLTGTALTTIVGVYLALVLSWREFVQSLAASLGWVLGLSVAFELWVSVVVRSPVLPFFSSLDVDDAPLLALWSRNLLFDGGRIQGILGNSNLLSVIALLGIVVFSLQLADKTVGRVRGFVGLALAVLVFGLTRSSTMILAAIVAAVTLAAVLIIRRAATPRARAAVYAGLAAVAAAGVLFVTVFGDVFLALFGKSSDITGRIGIWNTVIELASQRPWLGWGYSSPWIPWVEPFDDLIIRRGVVQLHAHNAWLDVWFQLGVLGLIVFTAVVVSTLWRSWFLAVDRPRTDLRADRPYSALSLLPVLIVVILLVQSVAESRILIESGWVLLVAIAVASKQRRVMDAAEQPDLTPVVIESGR